MQARKNLIDQVAEFFAEPLENAMPGLPDSPSCHFQLGGHFGRFQAVDGGPQKGPPGLFLEVALDDGQCPAEHFGRIGA